MEHALIWMTMAVAAPKNVILFVGDGMGPQQVGLWEIFADRSEKSPSHGRPTAFERLATAGTMGLSVTAPAEHLVTDSAGSATQLALGKPALVLSIGVDATGEPGLTVLERAGERGWSTGLVSDTRITHATPAAFGSHQPTRRYETKIAADLLKTQPDVMLSGGRAFFVPQSNEGSAREDDRDLLLEARAAGYDVVSNARELERAGPKVLGLFGDRALFSAIEETDTLTAVTRDTPTLSELTMAAIDRLSRDEDGFFLLVESGQIDWAAHNNDAPGMLHELARADRTLHAILDWMEGREDTLLVVTGDHETGGFGLTYGDAPTTSRPFPGTRFPDASFSPKMSFGTPAVLERMWAHRGDTAFTDPHLVWATHGHTHTPVPVYAVGSHAERFGGMTTHVRIGEQLHAVVSGR